MRMEEVSPATPSSHVKWFTKAAEQEFSVGEFNPGAMYWNGAGVPRDLSHWSIGSRKAAQKFAIVYLRSRRKFDN
jgi:TPR repeat protein